MSQSPHQPELFRRARGFADRTAVIDRDGRWSYGELLDRAESVARHLVAHGIQRGDRVAYLVEPGFGYVAAQWGIWMAGGIAVPLAISHPAPELTYTLKDSGAAVAIASATAAERLTPVAATVGIPLLHLDDLLADAPSDAPLPDVPESAGAMILYTSGTTSRPKGVVSRHETIRAQVATLVDAWGWTEDDHILLVLPLHHVHGIINVLTCALWSGARCTMHRGFDAEAVWGEIQSGDLTLFMAVPTVYSKLIGAWEEASADRRDRMSGGCERLRLMVSGSAALPVSVLERWREISGHTLLERYGMTEIGMALSNPLEGERRPGHVGRPLPGVELRLVGEDGAPVEPGQSGQIEVRGPSVFREYWNRPEATADAFRDGWFQTGDVAELNNGYYRILGRSSVDILKTGGYKVSALEIEEVLRRHPAVRECAVVGVPDEEWGDVVCAAVVADGDVEGDELRGFAAEHLAPYKLPRRWLTVPDLPRNAMGKVTKPAVKALFREA